MIRTYGMNFRQQRDNLILWVRGEIAVWVARVLLIGWSFVGQQIIIRPEFGAAGMFETITGIPAEFYGWYMVLVPLVGIIGKTTRDKVLLAQVPAWTHCMMTMLYSYFEVSGNLFALPFPTYSSICIALFLLAQVIDD